MLPVGKLDTQLLSGLIGDLPRDPSVVVGSGIGCDVAVLDIGAPHYLLVKSDPITFATDEIGYYAVTVNFNDIACAGGCPRWLVATLLLPESTTTEALVRDIFRQLRDACARHGVLLVGGHTEVTYGLDRPIIVCGMVGDVLADRLVTSGGAKPGDTLLLTKGIAVEGTSLIAREKRAELLAAGFETSFIDRCAGMLHDPGICVLEEARAATLAAPVHAMHDPTEGGVATGIWELADAAGAGMRVDAEALPIYPETRALCAHFGLDPLGLIASGSLLIAAAPGDVSAIIQACAHRQISCTVIGAVTDPDTGCVLVTQGADVPLPRFDQDEIGKLFG